MNERSYQFHLKEHGSLRSEIEYRIKTAERNEYVVAAALVGIYAWLYQQGVPHGSLLWWLPAGLPFLGIIRQAGLLFRIKQIGDYIYKLESAFCGARGGGWEHFLSNKRRHEPWKAKIIKHSGFAFMAFLFVMAIVMGYAGGLQAPTSAVSEELAQGGAALDCCAPGLDP